MAGRIVILQFDEVNRDAALDLVTDGVTLEAWGCKAVGVFLDPKVHCKCPDSKRRAHVNNWRKGKRTGIYLCAMCGKPSPHRQAGLMGRLEHIFGYNQMKVD